ncbi:DUF819 family protein [Geitlerinema sp. PCC 9228]|uniref:DUF819 family protein n=1 Tax=Geitlerinema sp. PCC 9228 TaxID=111611 RepID=UPI0008F9A84C|nr:DUF819 family protein [Geitlerinema sp. PCC 9228]
MVEALISPDQPFLLWAVLLSVAAFGLLTEQTPIGTKISAPGITMAIAFLLSNLLVIPSGLYADQTIPPYEAIVSYLVPLGIPLLLFHADISRILKTIGPTLIALVAGAVATVVGVAIAGLLLGEGGWQKAAVLGTLYAGNAFYQTSLSQAIPLETTDEFWQAGSAAVHLVLALYFLFLFLLPGIRWFQDQLPSIHPGLGGGGVSKLATGGLVQGKPISLLDMSLALAVGAIFCAAGYAIATALGWSQGGIFIVALLTVPLVTLFSSIFGSINGSEALGAMAMQLFFAVIGAKANIWAVTNGEAIWLVVAVFVLAVHFAGVWLASRVFRIGLNEMAIASNATLGGAATAAAMAGSRRWYGLVTPAIVCGTLAHAIAYGLGWTMGQFF